MCTLVGSLICRVQIKEPKVSKYLCGLKILIVKSYSRCISFDHIYIGCACYLSNLRIQEKK